MSTKTVTTCCEILANVIPCMEDEMDEDEGLDEASLAELEEKNFVSSDVGAMLLEAPVALVNKVSPLTIHSPCC